MITFQLCELKGWAYLYDVYWNAVMVSFIRYYCSWNGDVCVDNQRSSSGGGSREAEHKKLTTLEVYCYLHSVSQLEEELLCKMYSDLAKRSKNNVVSR